MPIFTIAIEDLNPCVKNFQHVILPSEKGLKIGYSYKTQFRFGRFSPPSNISNRSKIQGSILADVWKVDPHYVKWLMLNANGFAILPEALNVLLETDYFETNDLKSFCEEDNQGNISLNLINFKSVGEFKFHPKVRELPCPFTAFEKRNLKEQNLDKIRNNNLDCSAACTGNFIWGTNQRTGSNGSNILIKR